MSLLKIAGITRSRLLKGALPTPIWLSSAHLSSKGIVKVKARTRKNTMGPLARQVLAKKVATWGGIRGLREAASFLRNRPYNVSDLDNQDTLRGYAHRMRNLVVLVRESRICMFIKNMRTSSLHLYLYVIRASVISILPLNFLSKDFIILLG